MHWGLKEPQLRSLSLFPHLKGNDSCVWSGQYHFLLCSCYAGRGDDAHKSTLQTKVSQTLMCIRITGDLVTIQKLIS